VKRATVLPGAGSCALLEVELVRALNAEQAPLLARQLLTLKKYVAQVDTALTPLDEPTTIDENDEDQSDDAIVPLNLKDATLLRDLNDPDEAVPGPQAGQGR